MNYQFTERKPLKGHNYQKLQKSAARSRAGQSNYEADPDLLNDIAIDLPEDVQRSGKSRATVPAMSGKSARNAKTGDQTTQIVRSRGRPMKPHETEPFLSIDTLPPEKSFVSERTTFTSGVPTRPSTNRRPARQKSNVYATPHQRGYASPAAQASPEPPGSGSASGRGSCIPLQSPFFLGIISRPNTGTKSGSRSRSGSRPGSRKSSRLRFGSRRSTDSRRGGRDPPVNTPYMSPTKQMKMPNYHVKSPFKHAVGQSQFMPDDRLTPSQDLKERTAFALYQINRAITMDVVVEPSKPQGKLQKGRLKPLYPVKVDGPGIALCRGIVSDTKSYEASPSRTLQRRLHLMNTIPNVQDYLYEHRPRTVESVHQTSAASSIGDEDDDDMLDSNRSLPDEVLYTTPKPPSVIDPRSGSVTPDESVVNGKPDTSKVGQQQSVDVTPRMYATEPSTHDADVTKTDVTIYDHFQQELYISETSNSNLQRNNNATTRLYITYNDDNYRDDDSDTQKGGAVSPSKSVRFVEGGRSESQVKEEKDITNSRIANQQNEDINVADNDDANTVEITIKEREDENIDKSKKSGSKKKTNKNSCKSDEIVFKKDEDDDDDNKRNDKNKDVPNNNGNAGTGSGNTGQNKGDKSNKSISGNKNSDNKGQRQSSRSQIQHRSRSASLTRACSRTLTNGKNPTTRSQTPTRLSRPHTPSKTHACLKFQQSTASEPHANNLLIQTVIHGDSARNILCPESPARNNSHSQSPQRRNSTCGSSVKSIDIKSEFANSLFANHGNHTHTNAELGDFTPKSKVRFLSEEDKFMAETLFIEDDEQIDLDQDKPLTFEAIEAELENLRLTIQNKLSDGAKESNETFDEITYDGDNQLSLIPGDTVTDAHRDKAQPKSQPELIVQCHSLMKKTEDVETVRGGYSDLLEGYRRRCMDRSESCGEISAMLTTRCTPTVSNTPLSVNINDHDESENTNNSAIRRHSDTSEKMKSEYKTPILFSSQASDSGHGGSVDNLSELSRSASVAVSEVPPLDLEDTTSDLGLDAGHQDGEAENRNLLDIVCDELALSELQKEPPKLTKKETLRQKMHSYKIHREVDVAKLKVVATTKSATTKSFSMSKREKLTMATGTKAPFPPLCFTINARPPTGYLYYFAYGPDMNPNRFNCYIQREITDRFWALLFGFSLVFNKKGTSVEAGGFANLEFNPLRSTEGVMYKITPQELEILDKCVGYPQHYEHLVLPVWMSNSVDPDNYGVAQYCVPALTYIAQNDWTDTDTPLSRDYALSQCIKGADMLTTEYRQSLENMATSRQTVVAT